MVQKITANQLYANIKKSKKLFDIRNGDEQFHLWINRKSIVFVQLSFVDGKQKRLISMYINSYELRTRILALSPAKIKQDWKTYHEKLIEYYKLNEDENND